MSRIPGVKVVPYFVKIQDKDEEYYSQFTIIICGLDSVEARRWINATIVGMFSEDDPSSLRLIVDGGTEGSYFLKWYLCNNLMMVLKDSRGNQELSFQNKLHVMNVLWICRLNLQPSP